MIPGISETPATISDPVNAAILAVSEDRLTGFQTDPFGEIASRTGIPVETVIARIVAMLRAGTIRRVRQTLLSTSLAQGALCAWEVAPERLDAAFDFMFREDPFSGHVVIRTTDTVSAGSKYRLWTTLKVPQGFSLSKHARWLHDAVGAERYRLMPAKMLFALGVGHVRRRGLEPGARAPEAARPLEASVVRLSDLQWRVLAALKREFAPAEIVRDVWSARAREAGLDFDAFVGVARNLEELRVIGRFSTFLEHVKPTAGNERATRYNALFHWAVPPGREIVAGCEVARHGEGAGPGAQGGHRRAPAGGGRRLFVYQRLLGRAQRDQAVGDRTERVSRVLRIPWNRSRDDARRARGRSVCLNVKALFALAVLAAALAGCTKTSTTGAGGAAHSWTQSGVFKFSEASDPKNLNPALNSGTPTLDLSMFIYSWTIRYDSKAKPVPDALREIPTVANGDVSQDGLTLKYKLRPGIKWQDGAPLTCNDLKFTWQVVMNTHNNVVTTDGYKNIGSIDCSNPLVAVIHMKKLYAPFLQQLWSENGNAPILPEHLLAQYNDAKGSFNTASFNSLPVGSGPFKVVAWDRGQDVRMVANPYFYLGKPKLNEVIYEILPDENTEETQLQTHELDMLAVGSAMKWPQY